MDVLTITIVLVIWNVVTFSQMGIDKNKSIHGQWRIRERTLILSAFAMGGIGSLLGSLLFRHKTKKMKFQILLPMAVIVNVIIMMIFLY